MNTRRYLVALALTTTLATAATVAATAAPASAALTGYRFDHPITEPENGWITQSNGVTFGAAVSNMFIADYQTCKRTTGRSEGPAVMSCTSDLMSVHAHQQGDIASLLVQRAFYQSLVGAASLWTHAMTHADYGVCLHLGWAPMTDPQPVPCP